MPGLACPVPFATRSAPDVERGERRRGHPHPRERSDSGVTRNSREFQSKEVLAIVRAVPAIPSVAAPAHITAASPGTGIWRRGRLATCCFSGWIMRIAACLKGAIKA